jgi:hypothetical protein
VTASSVVVSVLAYHSRDTIEACLRSCLDLQHDGPLEIVVREQGGDDDEAGAIDSQEGTTPPSEAVQATSCSFSTPTQR